MRFSYLICYDICDDKRLRRVFQTMRGFGDHLQYSVFECQSIGEWFYGITLGLNTKNVFLRRNQFRLAEQKYFARTIARRLVAGKIRNQRTLLQRNHVEPNRQALTGMKEMAERAEEAGTSPLPYDPREESASAERSGERDAVAGVQPAGK